MEKGSIQEWFFKKDCRKSFGVTTRNRKFNEELKAKLIQTPVGQLKDEYREHCLAVIANLEKGLEEAHEKLTKFD